MTEQNRSQAVFSKFTHCFIPYLTGLSLTAGAAYASDRHALEEVEVLPLSLAITAAVVAESVCADQGYRVSVAVVDRGGLVKAHIRADGAGPHTLESARKKAFTSASMGRPTSVLVDAVVNNPSIEGLRDMDDSILILGGGLPIISDEEVIAGIGVGGAPGGHLDEACAQEGIDRILNWLDD
ncbi:MAG: heme-binding protein [Gammaproteobacteria bacterium]|nr:heme-binding protein [Gammaproteobacteria bacterium]